MQSFRLFIFCAAIALFSCSQSVTKKVIIFGRGKITAKENTVTMSDDFGSAEETVDVPADKPVTWNVTTPAGKTTVNIPEGKGFYLLNLKTDTVVGSQQVFGTDLSSRRIITQEELKLKIDSLTKLTAGSNLSAGHSYFVLPNQLIKVSDNGDAKLFGPFNKIPASLDADKNGKMPEIYKFYTNTEMRQLIASLKKATY